MPVHSIDLSPLPHQLQHKAREQRQAQLSEVLSVVLQELRFWQLLYGLSSSAEDEGIWLKLIPLRKSIREIRLPIQVSQAQQIGRHVSTNQKWKSSEQRVDDCVIQFDENCTHECIILVFHRTPEFVLNVLMKLSPPFYLKDVRTNMVAPLLHPSKMEQPRKQLKTAMKIAVFTIVFPQDFPSGWASL